MRDRIVELLNNNISNINFDLEKTLVDDNLIDSLTLMRVVTLISDEFKVDIPFEYLSPEYFNNVDAMTEMVKNLLG